MNLENELPENHFHDTVLCLNCFTYGGSSLDMYGRSQSKISCNGFSSVGDDGCGLVLGLGPAPSTYGEDYFHVQPNQNKEITPILKLGLSEGDGEAYNALESSDWRQSDMNSSCLENHLSTEDHFRVVSIADEGSTSAKKSGGYMPNLLLAPRVESEKLPLQTRELLEAGKMSKCAFPPLTFEPSAAPTDHSRGIVSRRVDSSNASSDHQAKNPKTCKFPECGKGARGSSGLCIGHGGGQRCQKPGCKKGAESRTAYCKAHGGGKRCLHLGCTKSAEGKTDYCIAHGGGRRCGYPGGCSKAARGRSGLCIRHGGGKRCKVEGCIRSAEGQAGLCISHGGGKRCIYAGCGKGAQGSTSFCKAHGGGKRCVFAGCTKGAEGSTPLCKGHGGGRRCMFDGGGICPKSVHGGTHFCVAHGGGKRCAVPGCTKSARGRTNYCVRHGGGKRCKFENCGKSAQGSTDFCKAHGGGRRCSWAEGRCEKFSRGRSGLCAAHSRWVLERETRNGGMIEPTLFRGVVSESIDSLEKPAKRRHLMPPRGMLPLSMKSSSAHSSLLSTEKEEEGRGRWVPCGRKSFDFDLVVTEGRVHGGALMSLLGGNLKNDGI